MHIILKCSVGEMKSKVNITSVKVKVVEVPQNITVLKVNVLSYILPLLKWATGSSLFFYFWYLNANIV